jgi:alpha-glucosidase (family GH31 glycosyl hydrolase)
MWGIWNDMNEPSVFINNLEQRGMPVHNMHVDKSGNKFYHMYVHNAYGGL